MYPAACTPTSTSSTSTTRWTDAALPPAPDQHSHIQWKPHYPVTTSSSSSRGGKITLRCCCFIQYPPGQTSTDTHLVQVDGGGGEIQSNPKLNFSHSIQAHYAVFVPFYTITLSTVVDPQVAVSLCVFLPLIRSSYTHKSRTTPQSLVSWHSNANNINFGCMVVGTTLLGKCAPLQTRSRPASLHPQSEWIELQVALALNFSSLSLSELLLRLTNSPEIIGPCVIDSSVQTLNSVSLCVFTCCWLLHQDEWRGNETLPRQIPLATCIRKLHATRNVDLVGKEIQIGTRTVLLSISESDRESESLAPRTPTTTTVDSRFSARTNSYCSCWGKSKFVKCIQISAITFHGCCTEWVNETSMSSRTFAPKALSYR